MSSSISGRENSGFAKDLDAVLAEARLQATNLRHGAAEPCRNGRHPDTALTRMIELRPEVGRDKLLVDEQVFERIDRSVRDIRALDNRERVHRSRVRPNRPSTPQAGRP